MKKGRDHFFDATRCDRCGADLSGGKIMSMYNTQVICMACKKKETRRSDYHEAVKADVEAIKRGERNFPGISWSDMNGKINDEAEN